ncbi:S-layer homology domain-containing protein, partial [Ureibacillus manganicus]
MKKKRKKIHFNRTFATTVLVSSALLLPTIVAASGFSDVKSTDYFSEYVTELVARDIIHGFPDGTFRPHQPITRGEAVRIITKLLDLDTSTVHHSIFKDVSENHIFYKEITALAEAKLISGYGDGTFLPEKPITRYEMAILLSNVFQLTSKNTETLPFKDIDPKFQQVVAVLYENHITSGTSETTFGGSQFVTRGQFAKFIILAEKASNIKEPNTEGSKDTPYEPPIALVISGIKDGEYYNHDIKILVNVGVSYLKKDNDPEIRISNGNTITEDGEYVFTNNYLGNKTIIRFVIDKIAPIISGVSEGEFYKQPVSPEFNEGEATLSKDGGPFDSFTSGTEIREDGHYELKVVDKAGNATVVEFTIDQVAPVISGVGDGEVRNSQFTPTFNEGTGRISKNGGEFVSFASGAVVDEEGQYTLEVTDEAGNVTIVQFTIDKTEPIITNVEEGKHYQSVAPEFNEGTAILTKDGGTGTDFISGTEITENGQYTLEVTDAAGNKTSVQFTVDNQAPEISGVIDGEIRNSQFTPTFNEGTGRISKDDGEFKECISGTTVSDEGHYKLEVEDLA